MRQWKGRDRRQQKGENVRSRRLGIAAINRISTRTQRLGDRKCGDRAHCQECHRAEALHNPLSVQIFSFVFKSVEGLENINGYYP